MREATPRVLLVGHTRTEIVSISSYLSDLGANDYVMGLEERQDSPHGYSEELLAFAGKLCYRSFEAGLNANVTKTRDFDNYIADAILKTGHGSVLEHVSASFLFHDVSRVFTHELVRHRVGSAFSQESLRYVRLTDLGFWMPEVLKEHDDPEGKGQKLIRETVEHLEKVQARLANIYKIDDTKSFALKKALTSAFRRVAPIGLSTAILWTANLRTLRHVIALRTSRHAEEEMRLVFSKVAELCKQWWPRTFSDMDSEMVNGHAEYTFRNPQQPYEKR